MESRYSGRAVLRICEVQGPFWWKAPFPGSSSPNQNLHKKFIFVERRGDEGEIVHGISTKGNTANVCLKIL